MRPRRLHPFDKDGVRRLKSRSDQQDRVGPLHILECCGHHILAIGDALYRPRHPRDGRSMDMCRSQKSLHHLVGDVQIFCQQIAGDMQCDAAGTMAVEDGGQAARNLGQRLFPPHRAAIHRRRQQTSFQISPRRQHLRSGAKQAAIRRVRRIPLDPHIPTRSRDSANAASHGTTAALSAHDHHGLCRE